VITYNAKMLFLFLLLSTAYAQTSDCDITDAVNGVCPKWKSGYANKCWCKDDVDFELEQRCKTYCSDNADCKGFYLFHKEIDFTTQVPTLVNSKQYCEFWTQECDERFNFLSATVRSYTKIISASYYEKKGYCSLSGAIQDMQLLEHTEEGKLMTTCDGCSYDPCDGKNYGDFCKLCDPLDPDCVEAQALHICSEFGECRPDSRSDYEKYFTEVVSENTICDVGVSPSCVHDYDENGPVYTDSCPDEDYYPLDNEESCRFYYLSLLQYLEKNYGSDSAASTFRVVDEKTPGKPKCSMTNLIMTVSSIQGIEVIFYANNDYADRASCEEAEFSCVCTSLSASEILEEEEAEQDEDEASSGTLTRHGVWGITLFAMALMR